MWTTLGATLLGAFIATGTSLLVESRRDRRAAVAEWRQSRRELYGAFLSALTKARGELWTISRDDQLPNEERAIAARAIFAGCYEQRYQLEVFAPSDVVTPALDYFRSVRRLRDAVGQGLRWDDAARPAHDDDVVQGLHATRDAMRVDMRTDVMRTE